MDLLLGETQGVQLNIMRVVGVSSFIESGGQGVLSVRLMGKCDVVLFGEEKKKRKSNRTFESSFGYRTSHYLGSSVSRLLFFTVCACKSA